MRIYNKFIVILVSAFSAATIIMAAYGVKTLDAYFSVYAVILLALTVLYHQFSPRARRGLSVVGLAAFVGFAVVIALKVSDMLSGG